MEDNIQSQPTSAWDKKEEEDEEVQAQLDIWKYTFGFVEQAVVKCAIELGIADAIESHGGPMTLSEISSTLGCDPSRLSRIIRFLIHRKIFKAIPTSHGNAYANTALYSRLMRNGHCSMAAMILLGCSPVMLATWQSAHVLDRECDKKVGQSPFVKAHGKGVWAYTAANPDHNNLFNEAMACDAKLTVPAIVEGCNEAFDGIGSLVDVGGGNGTALNIVVKACSWIRGINFDLPHVIAVAPKCDGVEHVAGDMFSNVPKADAAFLMSVLHDWADEECIQILKNCRKVVPKENGRVIIVEAVIEEGGEPDRLKDVRLMLDMIMMVHTNLGKERSLKEWEYVIKMARFTTYTVKAIPNVVKSVIMAFP